MAVVMNNHDYMIEVSLDGPSVKAAMDSLLASFDEIERYVNMEPYRRPPIAMCIAERIDPEDAWNEAARDPSLRSILLEIFKRIFSLSKRKSNWHPNGDPFGADIVIALSNNEEFLPDALEWLKTIDLAHAHEEDFLFDKVLEAHKWSPAAMPIVAFWAGGHNQSPEQIIQMHDWADAEGLADALRNEDVLILFLSSLLPDLKGKYAHKKLDEIIKALFPEDPAMQERIALLAERNTVSENESGDCTTVSSEKDMVNELIKTIEISTFPFKNTHLEYAKKYQQLIAALKTVKPRDNIPPVHSSLGVYFQALVNNTILALHAKRDDDAACRLLKTFADVFKYLEIDIESKDHANFLANALCCVENDKKCFFILIGAMLPEKICIGGLAFNLACLYNVHDMEDEALKYVGMAIDMEYEKDYFHSDPCLQSLSDDPRFIALVGKN